MVESLKPDGKDSLEEERRPPGAEDRGEGARYRYASPEALFAAEYASLSRALALIAGDLHAAEDAVQEAFAELCRNWKRVSEYEDQAAWVRRVAINRVKDQKRSLKRRTEVFLRLRREPDSHASPAPLPDTELHRSIRRLPQKQRTAVALYYLADLSVAQVAQAMGVSEGTVKRHLDRARETLRSTLEAGRP